MAVVKGFASFTIEGATQRLRACQSEGKNYFKDDRIFIERFIQNPKHIEVQVFGDTHGNVVHLYERECSMQRRHQKLIEECPSISVPPKVREKLGEVAVRAAKSIQYVGARVPSNSSSTTRPKNSSLWR